MAHSADSWRDKVESGAIFHDLDSLESKDMTSRRQRRQHELASISEPSKKAEEKQLQVVESRAEHAVDSHSALAGMEAMVSQHMAADASVENEKVKGMGLGAGVVDLAALRRRAAAHEPKYAGKAHQPHFQSVVPRMDQHIVALEKYIGEGKAKGSTAYVGVEGGRKAAVVGRGAPRKSQLSMVEGEIASFRHAAHAEARRERKADKAEWRAGEVKAAKVEDRFSMANSDVGKGARGSMSRVVKRFS